MRALVVQPRAPAEAFAPERQRQPDDVVRVDQVVRWGIEAKLGEDAPNDIELHPITRDRPSPAKETKMIRQSNGADCRVFASRIANRAERAAQKARERMGFF